MNDSTEDSNEPTGSQPSSSSQSPSSPAWWRAPERVIAVAGAISLTAFGRLDQSNLVIVLTVALGAPLTQLAVEKVAKRLAKAK